MKIGITGGIGSGKSYVCQLLAKHGIGVYDCDAAAKRLIRTSPIIYKELTALIGPDTYIDGTLNKVAVAQFLLQSEEHAKAVDAIVHPAVFEDFEKMDIRTATVLEAERVPKTDKLLKLTIDTGIDTRTIVSGIAEFYSPEVMLGKQICILANLAPRKIRGIESKGMILMARQGDGKMRFITPQEVLNNGAQIG